MFDTKYDLDPLTGDPMPRRSVLPPSEPQTPPAAVKDFIPNLTLDELHTLSQERLSEAIQFVDPKKDPELCRKLYAEIKDRRDGRPKQSMELTGKDGEPLSVRLLAAQQRLLKDITPNIIEHLPLITDS